MQVSYVGVQLLSTIVLARFLAPSDYALLGMVNIFLVLANLFVDSGMGGAIIYKKNVMEVDYSTLFVFNIIASFLIYLVLYFMAPWVAGFYKEDILVLLIRILSLTVIIHAVGIMSNTRLMKNLKFKSLAIISIIAGCFSFFTALILALKGAGVWSLVGQQLAQSVIITFLLVINSKKIPRLRFSYASFKEQIAFSINCVFGNLVRLISDNIFINYVAKVETASVTGYYVQASKFHTPIINVANSVIDRSLFPMFSKINNNLSLLVTKIEKYTFVIVGISVIVTPLLVLLSSDMIVFLLGEKWADTSVYFSILLTATPAFVCQSCIRNALKSLGRTKQILYNDLIRFFLIISILLFFYSYSIFFIIWGMIFSQYMLTFILCFILNRYIKMKYGHFLKEICRNAIPSIFAYLCLSQISFRGGVLQLIGMMVLYFLISLPLLFVLRSQAVLCLFQYVKSKYIRKEL